MPRATNLPKSEIVARYNGGESIEALAAAYSRSGATMRENLHRWGAAIRRRGPTRQYALDELFFSSIDTESKAYWLGFILADGHVGQAGSGNWICRVDLGSCDRHHLEKLAAAIGTTVPVKSGHHGASAYLCLCSARLCLDLQALECSPNKTGRHGTPKIRESLMRHFYRGYFDGDGSLFASLKNDSWSFDVIGPTKFIVAFQQWLMHYVGVSKTALRGMRAGVDVSSVRYQGGRQVERVMRLLYDGATVYLERKFDRFRHLLARSVSCVV